MEQGLPPTGSYVLLTVDQADALLAYVDVWLRELAWARGAGIDFVLGRIEASEGPARAPALDARNSTTRRPNAAGSAARSWRTVSRMPRAGEGR